MIVSFFSQSEFMRRLAGNSHFLLGDLMNRANRLRNAGMIKSGGRGRSACNIEPSEAALIILAAMSGVSANECPDVLKKLPDGLMDALTTIIDKAEPIEWLAVDYINNCGMVKKKSGETDIFGKTGKFKSRALVELSGDVLRLLSVAMQGGNSA